MRISDWSSDVCSSDLMAKRGHRLGLDRIDHRPHPAMGGARAFHAFGLAGPPLRAMFGGAVFRWIDDLAHETPVAPGGNPMTICQAADTSQSIVRQIDGKSLL